jgi:uncharacterized protein (DUF427 family)
MDVWYEEDEKVFVHPSDPYHRVVVLKSSRYVRVKVNGEVVAETDRSTILFETGLPPRWVDVEVEGERQERPHTSGRRALVACSYP